MSHPEAGSTRGLWTELKEAIEEQIELVFGKEEAYAYVLLLKNEKPVKHFVVRITNLPHSSPEQVFALITEEVAREIISGDGTARKHVCELLTLHKTGRVDSDHAQELQDLLFPPMRP